MLCVPGWHMAFASVVRNWCTIMKLTKVMGKTDELQRTVVNKTTIREDTSIARTFTILESR